MGQQIGKANVVAPMQPFVNLSQDACLRLWEAFHDIAEGFGLQCDEVQEICETLVRDMMCEREELDEMVERLFQVMDSDENGLIDALELMATFAMFSGMSLESKAEFSFNVFDFDESKVMSIDEICLMFKQALCGAAKVTASMPPPEAEVSKIAEEVFRKFERTYDEHVSRVECVEFCMSCPEVHSWMSHYDTSPDYYAVIPPPSAIEFGDVLGDEGAPETRDVKSALANDQEFKPSGGVVGVALGEAPSGAQSGGGAPGGLAIRPWLHTIESTVPSQPPPIEDSSPDSRLQVEWVYGFNAQHMRNNVRYTAQGHIAYPAAGITVVYDKVEKLQRFNVDHTDTILAMAVHPTGNLIATAEAGRVPKVVVWDAETQATVSTIRGFHQHGVAFLAFSGNGNNLVMVGMDRYHTTTVYDWRGQRLIASCQGTEERILACGMASSSNHNFVTGGKGHISFWEFTNDGVLQSKPGVYRKIGEAADTTCLAFKESDGNCISGTNRGLIYEWNGRTLMRTVKAFASSAVLSIHGTSQGFATGSANGRIRMWSTELSPGGVFSVSDLGSYEPAVTSVCWDPATETILLGTRGSEIYEISATDGADLHGGPLVQGHCAHKLCGLAVHPSQSQVCTVGDDRTVRIWDTASKQMLKMTRLDAPCRAVAYSPDGMSIAVGLGADVGPRSKKEGAFAILNEDDLTVIFEGRDTKKWITAIRFSPDSNTLAIASRDSYIYLYNVEDFTSKGKCRGPSGPVTNFDFSADSQWIQSNSNEYELTFNDGTTGRQQKSALSMKDIDWSSWSCPLGWPTQGAWPATAADGTEVSTCDRSQSGITLAAGDQYGRIRLYRYPCVTQGASYNEFKGHSPDISCLRFSSDDEYLFSIGAYDRCLIQWRHGIATDEELAEELGQAPDEEDAEDLKDGGVAFDRSQEQYAVNEGVKTTYFEYIEEYGFAGKSGTTMGGGKDDAFAAVKPWLNRIVAPSAIPQTTPECPESELELDWVYGYRGHDCRNNIYYNTKGSIIYHVAKVCIVYDREKHLQRFMLEHTDDVVSICMHPDGVHVATGALGRNPTIIVWNSITLSTVRKLEGFHKRAVTSLSFSNGSAGNFLVSAGQDMDHSIAIYDWRNGNLIASAKGEARKVMALSFSPDNSTIVQCGVDHVQFWRRQGRNLLMRRGILGKKGRIQPLLCIGWAGPFAVVGTADGHLYRFEGHMLRGSLKAHDKSVTALYSCPDGLVSGGRDRRIRIWSPGLECRHDFDMAKLQDDKSLKGGIRALCWEPAANTLVIGTRGGELYEISSINGADLHGGPIVASHCVNEVWGLSIHPKKPHFATAGDDKTIRVWNYDTHEMIDLLKLDTPSRAIAYAPDGNSIAIGLGGRVGRGRNKKDGVFMILDGNDLKTIHEGRDTREWITDAKYTPDGNTLALASRDNNVYFYDATNGYAPRAVFGKHSSFVTNIDFTEDSQWLQSCSGAYDLLFCDANTGAHLPSGARIKDLQWDTWTMPMGWSVQGVWKPYEKGVEINTTSRSNRRDLLAVGDEYGRLRVYRYPCLTEDTTPLEYSAHSPHLLKVRWTKNDKYLLSLGGKDRSVMQWRHILDDKRDDADIAGDSGDDSDLPHESEPNLLPEGAEAFLSNRPWAGAIAPPTRPPRSDPRRPLETIDLEWVYGYRSTDCRNNVRYSSNGKVVFHSGAVGVVYDKDTHLQTFHNGYHEGDIMCLTVDPTRCFVATGEEGDRPGINVWEANSSRLLCRMEGAHFGGGIVALAFSQDGCWLASIGTDPNHLLCVWRSTTGSWTDGKLVSSHPAGRSKMLFVHWTGKPEYPLMTGGLQGEEVRFWSMKPGTMGLWPVTAKFGRKGKVQPLLCAATVGVRMGEGPNSVEKAATGGGTTSNPSSSKYSDKFALEDEEEDASVKLSIAERLFGKGKGLLVTGTVTGHLYVWEGRNMVRPVKAHERSVTAIHAAHGGWSDAAVVTGSKDGTVKLWNADIRLLKVIDMGMAEPAPRKLPVRSVCYDPRRERIVVGMLGSEIYELTRETGSTKLLTQGHCEGELWGCAPHPLLPHVIATSGDDETVRIWDIERHVLLRTASVGGVARAVQWSPDGSMIALGMGRGEKKSKGGVADGVMLVLHAETLDILHEARDTMEWITDIKFSEDGSICVVGAMDGGVYVYDVNRAFELSVRCVTHESYITHVDISDDATRIQANTGSQELLFYDATTGDLIASPSTVKNVDWSSWTCTLGWPVQGIWPDASATDAATPLVNSTHRAINETLLAVSDEYGGVRVYRYPVIDSKADFIDLKGHSMHVTKVAFNKNDSHLLTCGGSDRSLMQWKLGGRRTESAQLATLEAEPMVGEKQETKEKTL
jgi:echinoderm microtubule-associated protein-like 6